MIGRSPDIEGTRSVAEIHCEDALEPGMIGRSPDIEGTRSVTEIHCGIVVGNKEENNMTDNYNDDYREVIPEEEKTETNVSETQDNEKNNGNTQVADTAKENSTEKKSEDKKDSSEYEDVCFICRRPESKAGRMFKLPNHICICDDCMHKTMETVSQFDYQGMLNNPNDFNQFNGQNGFPNISFVNLADLQGDGGIPNKQTEAGNTEGDGSTTLIFAGDVLFANAFKSNYDAGGIEKVIEPQLLQELQDADIFMVNNEFPFSNRGEPMEDKQFTFCCDPKYVKALNEMGVDIVSLANNHTLDYGRDALSDTFTTLDGAGILYAGAGETKERAYELQVIEKNGKKFGFLAASRVVPESNWKVEERTPGMLTAYDDTKLVQLIKEARSECKRN